MITREYEGDAELLDEGGQVIDEVTIALLYTYNSRTGLGEWSGRIQPTDAGPGDWILTRQIRLSSGETGDCFVVNIEESGGTQTAWINGSDSPPF